MTWRAWVLAVVVTLSPAAAQVLTWVNNSPKFVFDNFGVTPDPWQLQALEAFDNPAIKRISLQACVGPGKTAVESWMGWKFLTCHGARGEHPKGACFSVTWENLTTNLWPEFSKWQQRSEYLREAFVINAESIYARDHPETWFLSARSWPKTANPEEQGKTLAGIHSPYVLVLADESGSIPATMLRACDQIFSTGPVFGKVVQSGNPLSLEGMLYAAAQLGDQWHVIRITGDPEDPNAWVHAPRVGSGPIEWAREQIAAYGRDNPWVMSSILGKFPPASINALLSVDEVRDAMQRHLPEDQYAWAQKRLGVDVARFGDDRTVLFPRQGLASFNPSIMRHGRDSAVSVNIAARVMAAKAKWGSEVEFFDATGGWAAGAVDVMRDAGLSPVNVQFAAPALDARFANVRAELWWTMAEWVKSGAALPPIAEMVQELTQPTYTFVKGRIQLEEKAQIKKRLGRSPDLADALALTFGFKDMPSALELPAMARGRQAHASSEWDPYDGSRS